jgi:hypothetical protein
MPAGQRLAWSTTDKAKWRDTSARSVRTADLPLHDPPAVRLTAQPEGEAFRVTVVNAPPAISTRWQATGHVAGDGGEVVWRPSSTADQVRVAVRSRGGVAVVSLRAKDLPGRKA